MSDFIYKKPRSKTFKKEIEIIKQHKALSNKTTPDTTPTTTPKTTPKLKKKEFPKDNKDKNKNKNKYNPDDAQLDLGLLNTKLFQESSIV